MRVQGGWKTFKVIRTTTSNLNVLCIYVMYTVYNAVIVHLSLVFALKGGQKEQIAESHTGKASSTS